MLTPDARFAGLQELSYAGVAAGGRVFHADILSGSVSNVYCCGRPGSGLAISDDGSQIIFPGNDGLYFREMSSTNRLLVRDVVSGFEMPLNIRSFQVSRDFERLFFAIELTNRPAQLFAYDFRTEQTSLISSNSLGLPINASILSPFSISDSGAVIAFETAADDLGPKDFNRAPDIYVSGLGLISWRDAALPERTGLGFGTLFRGAVSADGNRITFTSTDSSLTLNDTNRRYDVFVRDLRSNAPTSIGGLLRSNTAAATVISADGQSVVYERFAGEEQVQSMGDLWRADLRTGQTYPLVTFGFRGPWYSWDASLSQDGRWLVIRDADGSSSDGHIRVTDFRTPIVF